ncbi:VOC family protein [Geomicrobium sp. JCM 19039]|uniref:VOC family protein n=1 Tax=Geomicrobium sp. JCM 19039 TaxID=1460636 RepID=UPI00045F4034|nr:VOC family protein [Geomicrobium sp. JCM 19039]GAK11132.1 glyoxalase/bleomycin resistance protein/dioxygenase [Geomicrobium sp. JCM 19039]
MTLPIRNEINSIFVHVKDLNASAVWYSDLVGVKLNVSHVESPVHNVPVRGTTSLTLDDHRFDPNFHYEATTQPLFNLYAPNIQDAYNDIQNKGIRVVREIEHVGETAWFNIEDPDGNVIMICNC